MRKVCLSGSVEVEEEEEEEEEGGNLASRPTTIVHGPPLEA
jgi:hypothetical protein